jgi:hypothetical protein
MAREALEKGSDDAPPMDKDKHRGPEPTGGALQSHEEAKRAAYEKIEAEKAAKKEAARKILEKTGAGAREDSGFEELEKEIGK